jgi:hypothetical protein
MDERKEIMIIETTNFNVIDYAEILDIVKRNKSKCTTSLVYGFDWFITYQRKIDEHDFSKMVN